MPELKVWIGFGFMALVFVIMGFIIAGAGPINYNEKYPDDDELED